MIRRTSQAVNEWLICKSKFDMRRLIQAPLFLRPLTSKMDFTRPEIRSLLAIVLVAVGNLAVAEGPSAQPIAFPGAVGQGAAAVGGRGGDVYHVVTLSDYDEDKGEAKIKGSLRHAIDSAKGPRTIVFDVGGAIRLHGPLEIRHEKLTIAGQSAPGGITVWGYPLNISKSSDIILRYVRARLGDFNARAPRRSTNGDQAPAGKGAKNLDAATGNGVDVGRSQRVIIDHVSAAWGMDETLSVTLSRDVTVQNTIIAQSLNHSFHPKGAHGYGTLIRGELTDDDQEAGAGGYTFYGNLWAFHRARNPSIGGQQRLFKDQPESERRRADVNLVNNVVYGWTDRPTYRSQFGDVRINLIGNYYINGPMKRADYIFYEGEKGRTFLFHKGNMLDADQDGIENGKPVGLADDVQRTFREFDSQDKLIGPTRGKPFNFIVTLPTDKVLTADDAYARVIASAGASLARDPIDARIVESVVHRTGTLIDTQEALRDKQGKLAGIEDVPSGRRPPNFDVDGDGMSDKFETEHGLNPHDPADGNGTNLSKDGYTNLEVYLNSLVADGK